MGENSKSRVGSTRAPGNDTYDQLQHDWGTKRSRGFTTNFDHYYGNTQERVLRSIAYQPEVYVL